MSNVWIVACLLALASAHAQDVHVHVSHASQGTIDSREDFPTIQMAMDHAPQPGPGGRLVVHIAPGSYAERVMVTANRPRTTFLGDPADPAEVVITSAQNARSAGGTFFTETVDVEALGFEADGVSFANTAGPTGQAVAIAVRSDQAVFKHCRFVGFQDTLFADFGRQYYLDSYITGGVDFIFGNAAAVFDRSEVHEQTAGYLMAQSRTSALEKTGFVLWHSRVTSNELQGKKFFLGRPWRSWSRVAVIATELPTELDPAGWSPWHAGEQPLQADYAESGNTGAGAATGARAGWTHRLSPEQTAAFSPERFLAGEDGWNPENAAAKLP